MSFEDTNRGRVLVTGGTGFLGQKIVKRLREMGREVAVLARRPSPDLESMGITQFAASLGDEYAVNRACEGVKTIYHVAAKVGVWGPYEQFFAANVVGTRNLLKSAQTAGVSTFIYTSTPSVVYNGRDLAGVDERLPLTTACPSPYPLTKALAEREVLQTNSATFRTVALRPHLIWGAGDPHLVPRILARAQAGRLRIVGEGLNRVDMVHVENAADAHLNAERLLWDSGRPAGKAYFISNDEPVVLWHWINSLLRALGQPEVTKKIPLGVATSIGAACEAAWKLFMLQGEPPMTRFVAAELAKDHWFDISAAKRDLEYKPQVSMEEGMRTLVESLLPDRRA